jgi:hypothetical protein
VAFSTNSGLFAQSEDYFEFLEDIPENYWQTVDSFHPEWNQWIDSVYLNSEDTCSLSFDFISSVIRFDNTALVEIKMVSDENISNVFLRLKGSENSINFPGNTSISNQIVFDSLMLDTVYTVHFVDLCLQEQFIGNVFTHPASDSTDVVMVSPQLFNAISDFHEQDTSNALDLVEFLFQEQGLSKYEVLSYLQTMLRWGQPYSRSILDQSSYVLDDIASTATPGQGEDTIINPNLDSYCNCKIAQSHLQTVNPFARIVNENRFTPLTDLDIRKKMRITGGRKEQQFMRSIGPARRVGLAAAGIALKEDEISLATGNSTPGINGHFAQLRYNLTCVTRRALPSGGCDCVREGEIDWGYHVFMQGEVDVQWGYVFPKLAAGNLTEVAWLLKVQGDSFEVVDVASHFIEAECNTNFSRDFLVDALLIRERMGLSILRNLTLGSDTAKVSVNWANAATEIIDRIENLLKSDSIIIGMCNQPTTYQRQMLGTLNNLSKRSFVLSMGKPVSFILGSSSLGQLKVRGTCKAVFESNSAFHLAGWVFGGEPRDVLHPDNPRNLRTCCGSESSNFVQANVPGESPVARSENALLRDIGIFLHDADWISLNGPSAGPFPRGGDGVIILPGFHVFAMRRWPIDIPEYCLFPFNLSKKAQDDFFESEMYGDPISVSEDIFDVNDLGQFEHFRIISINGYSIDIKNQWANLGLEQLNAQLVNLPQGVYLIQAFSGNRFVNFKIAKL